FLKQTTLTLTISRRQLENPHFIYKLSQVLQEMQIDPTCLVLEISEKSIIRQRSIIDKTLGMLKNLGVKIGISQFGAGNISWWELQNFSIYSIKISASIIQNMLKQQENIRMIETMLTLAKTLQIKVIADGIECMDEVTLLKKMQCDFMQGNFILPPKLLSDFIQELEGKTLEKI
ncbi:MAG TPA: EAL domain-containing protein, partial [Gammaproteobacteria bacterium]|nr:EAL domain-containing protein [Gammaproteobacteria bacterium]